MSLSLTSTAFSSGDSIPARHTCSGADVSPPLRWSGIPAETKTLALVCDDPDAPAGTWVHWVLYGLPPQTASLPEGVPGDETLSGGGTQGRNDFRKIGYGGPCPPPGAPHRYYFKLYALDVDPGLDPGATKADLEAAMSGHIIAQGHLMGTFRR